MTTPLVIIGAGGHGRETLDVFEAMIRAGDRRYEFAGFVADGEADSELLARRNARYLGPVSWLEEHDAAYVIGIGDGNVRRVIADRLSAAGRTAAVLVHPLASIGGDVELGPGCVLAAGARVTTNVRMGRHSHVNVNANVSHDCRVGDFVTVSPGTVVCGTVRIGDAAYLGANACVLPGLTIGAGAMVGAGACVVRDVADGEVVVGVPAVPRQR